MDTRICLILEICSAKKLHVIQIVKASPTKIGRSEKTIIMSLGMSLGTLNGQFLSVGLQYGVIFSPDSINCCVFALDKKPKKTIIVEAERVIT